jgi:transposase
MNRLPDVILTAAQRHELEQLLRKGKVAASLQRRARILLLSDRSQGGPWRSAPAIAALVFVHPNTVRNVQRCFVRTGFTAALYGKPPPGAAPKLDGVGEAHLLMLACSEPPPGHTRWTLRLLADRLVELGDVESISHVSVGARLKKTKSSPGA